MIVWVDIQIHIFITRNSPPVAIQWLLEHENDPTIDDPIAAVEDSSTSDKGKTEEAHAQVGNIE